MKFHVDIELHVEAADADIMFIFPNTIQDRFSGTAVHIDEVKVTRVIEVESRDKKKKILADSEIEAMCFEHYDKMGRIAYLINGVCPLDFEHEDSQEKQPL